jgi:tetratricopeptide (TPR) repeat protein
MNKINFIILFSLAFIFNFGLNAQTIPTFPQADDVFGKKPTEPDKEKLAAEYVKNKEFDKAVVLYEELFEEKQTHFFYTYYLYCLSELQDYKEALKLTRKQTKNSPERLRYMVDEGYIYTLSGEPEKANKIFDEAFDEVTANANQIKELANAYNYRGQTDYAINTYLKGRELLHEEAFNLELANIYMRLERYDEMVDEYLDLLEVNLSRLNIVESRLQSALNDDPEGLINDALRTELLRRIQRNPEILINSEMLIWLSIQQKDFEMALIQAKSIDRRLQEDGSRVMKLSDLCISNESYDVAIDAFDYLLTKGTKSPYYLDARIGLLNTRYLKITNRYDYTEQDLFDLKSEYERALYEFGENASTVPIMRYMAHLQAFYLDEVNQAIELLNKAVDMPGVQPALKADCKIELGDILLFKGDVWDATLLYSQVDYDFKNDALGHMAKYKNARLSYYIGEFGWSKAQLDVLKAATSKLIANDAMELSLLISDNIDMDSSYTALSYYSKADLLMYQNKLDEALTTLDSIQMVALWHPLHDEVLFKKGEIFLKSGEFETADSLFAQVVEMYPEDILADNALMIRAELNENQFGNIDVAMQLYERVMFDYTGSLFVVEARKRYRDLRGDELN